MKAEKSFGALALFIFFATVLVASSAPPQNLMQETPGSKAINTSDIRFLLWTRSNPGFGDYQELVFGDHAGIENSFYDPAKKTKVIEINGPALNSVEVVTTQILAHGFILSGDGSLRWEERITAAYLTVEDCNVISVDWHKLAGGPNFPQAAYNALPAGEHAADFIRQLISDHGAAIEDFHVVGFSLGGQMVAGIGQGMGGALKRITALDPAGPMFYTVSESERLSPDDAEFVDVIHTAGLWIGYDLPLGDADFFPNGGLASQTGCDIEGVELACSHDRAWEFLEESILSEGSVFLSRECSSMADFDAGLCDDVSTNYMGEKASPDRPGTFYLRTNSQPPFSISP